MSEKMFLIPLVTTETVNSGTASAEEAVEVVKNGVKEADIRRDEGSGDGVRVLM